jgi:TetR/AcrR family transcriptional repressor of lmrAB and yxaGH operons
MDEPATTRQRMVQATERLLRRRGYAAASWRNVVHEAAAPWGSAYHHFPEGKEQLAAEAVALGGSHVGAALDTALQSTGTVAAAVRRWFALAAENLKGSDFQDGCPVATVALETAPQSATLTGACSTAFARWESTLASAIAREGCSRRRAGELATLVVANLEGALLLSRVRRDTRPLRLAAELLATRLEAELGSSKPPR